MRAYHNHEANIGVVVIVIDECGVEQVLALVASGEGVIIVEA
jgi:hypothetical protein